MWYVVYLGGIMDEVMDDVEVRRVVWTLRDMVKLLDAGIPIPMDYVKSQLRVWEKMIEPKPSSNPPPPDLL